MQKSKFKSESGCAICGAPSYALHHIRALKHKGGRYTGFRGFDKIVASLYIGQKTTSTHTQHTHTHTLLLIGSQARCNFALPGEESHFLPALRPGMPPHANINMGTSQQQGGGRNHHYSTGANGGRKKAGGNAAQQQKGGQSVRGPHQQQPQQQDQRLGTATHARCGGQQGAGGMRSDVPSAFIQRGHEAGASALGECGEWGVGSFGGLWMSPARV
jgi:hypothetical protein